MCGIWGVITDAKNGFNQQDIRLMYEMAVVTSLRGAESSGMYWGYNNSMDRTQLTKVVGDPYNIFHDRDNSWEKISKSLLAKGKFIIGHGRWATQGNVSIKNAHPFRHEHVTLVHNGTVDGLETTQDKEVQVDSHAMCIDFANRGPVETLKAITGGAAIIWHDAKEQALFFYRNSQKDLHFHRTNLTIRIMTGKEDLEFLLKKGHDYYNSNPVQAFEAGFIYRFNTKSFLLEKSDDIQTLRWKSTYVAPSPSPSPTVPFIPRKNGLFSPGGRGLEFEVTSVEKDQNSAEYLYEGRGKNGETIFTRSSTVIEVGRKGYASCFRQIYPVGSTKYVHIKFRDVVWDSAKDDVSDGVVAPGATSSLFVTTRNERKINAKTWMLFCRDKTCKGCGNLIDPSTVSKCCVLHKEGTEAQVICEACSNEIEELASGSNADLNSVAHQLLH